MAERLDCKIRRTFQNEQNNHTFWQEENINNLTQISSDINYHYLGCLGGSMDLRFSIIKKNGFGNANNLLFKKKSETLSNNYLTESEIVTINCECNVFKRDFEMKRNGCEIHDGCISLLQSTNELQGDKIENIKYADIELDIKCEKCFNQGTIELLQTQFGKLLRIGILEGNTWITKTPSEMCHFVHAYPFHIQGSSTIKDNRFMSQVPAHMKQNEKTSCYDNNFILVDTFEKSDRSSIGTFIGFGILRDSDPKELINYITSVAKFGFNHIIIIGEIYFGMVFLDCYSRVFVWEDETQMVFPLGNSPEEASKSSIKEEELAWFVKNGNVYEYIMKP